MEAGVGWKVVWFPILSLGAPVGAGVVWRVSVLDVFLIKFLSLFDGNLSGLKGAVGARIKILFWALGLNVFVRRIFGAVGARVIVSGAVGARL